VHRLRWDGSTVRDIPSYGLDLAAAWMAAFAAWTLACLP
jgi:hypothetical protein